MTMKTPAILDGGYASLKTAMCQVYTEPWKVESNFTRTLAALDEAARKGGELAITPECVLHGYGFEGVPDYSGAMEEAAEPIDGPHLRAFRDKAIEHRMAIIVGFAEKGASGNIHNAAAHIAPNGEVLAVYRKVHCRSFERKGEGGVFVPGDEFTVHNVTGEEGTFRVGTMICFDREVVESVRCLRALGAQLIACPLATDTTDMSAHANHADNEMVTRCRAAENEVFIVVVNHAGRYNGGTFAVGPGGELIYQMGKEPGVIVLDLPIGAIPDAFHREPLGWMGWGYRRPEVYGKYL